MENRVMRYIVRLAEIVMCFKKLGQRWFATIILLSFMVVSASPKGNMARPIQQYLKLHPINSSALRKELHTKMDYLNKIDPSTLNIHDPTSIRISVYPIWSTKLSPGLVKIRKVTFALPQPIFIIGNDNQSKHWLKRYAKRLRLLQAKGFVVNVATLAELQALKHIASGLTLYPLPGNLLATQLGLRHYPALISNHLIEQ